MRFLLGGLAVILVPIFIYCLIGFLTTFQPPGSPGWRVLYGAIMVASVIFIGGVMVTGLRNKPGPGEDPNDV